MYYRYTYKDTFYLYIQYLSHPPMRCKVYNTWGRESPSHVFISGCCMYISSLDTSLSNKSRKLRDINCFVIFNRTSSCYNRKLSLAAKQRAQEQYRRQNNTRDNKDLQIKGLYLKNVSTSSSALCNQ